MTRTSVVRIAGRCREAYFNLEGGLAAGLHVAADERHGAEREQDLGAEAHPPTLDRRDVPVPGTALERIWEKGRTSAPSSFGHASPGRRRPRRPRPRRRRLRRLEVLRPGRVRRGGRGYS